MSLDRNLKSKKIFKSRDSKKGEKSPRSLSKKSSSKIFNKLKGKKASEKSSEIERKKNRQNSLKSSQKNFKNSVRQRGLSEGVAMALMKGKKNDFKIVCNLVNEEIDPNEYNEE